MSSSNFQLTMQKDFKLSEIPSEEALVQAAFDVLNSSSSWKAGKTFHKVVRTYSKSKGPGDGAPWHARVSEHTAEDATFDEFWSKLGEDHAQNEKEYIKEVKKCVLLKKISPTMQVWNMYYEFPPPVSPRIFTVLQLAHLIDKEGSSRQGLFIQLPVDISDDPELSKLEEKGTRGHYTSVESFKELEDGRIEWRMATSSTPGGRIPNFIVESTMAGQIAADVPHFLHWLHSIRQKPTEANAAATEGGAEAKAPVDQATGVDPDIAGADAAIPVAPMPGVPAPTTGVPSAAGLPAV